MAIDPADLEKQFNADKDAIKARGNAYKFSAVGDGTYVDVLVDFQSRSFTIGRATSIKKGSASFLVKQVVVGLSGAYVLNIDDKAARVSKGGKQIWFWTAEAVPEKGILGSVDVVFNHGAITTLAALLSTLYP